ncbi:MAG: glycosyltransferase family 61 protein [Luteimonas sp.]
MKDLASLALTGDSHASAVDESAVDTLWQSDPFGQSRRSLTEGLAAERAGNFEKADRCFEQIALVGVPLPNLLLECGRYFKRRALYEQAFTCFAKAHPIGPDAVARFCSGLPAAILARYLPWVAANMLGGSRPGFYGFQLVKSAVVEWLGITGAAAVLAPTFATTALGCQGLELASLKHVARARGLAYEVLSPGKEFFFHAPVVAGGSERQGFTATTRTFFRCLLPDVVVSSKSNFVLAQGQAILDYQDDELAKCPLDLDVDPIVVAADGSHVFVLAPEPAAAITTFDDALSLVGVHSYAFGHWLLEFLPKLWAWRGQPGFADVPVLVDAQMPSQHREALEMFLSAGQRVVTLKPGERVRVRRLWTASMPCYMPLGPKPGPDLPELLTVDTACFAALMREALPHDQASPTPHARVYLSRKPNQHRKLVNYLEVEAWFRAQGFVIVDPAEITFAEQLRLMRDATMVVGPDGSAVFMALFARTGTIVRTFSHPFLDDTEWFAALGAQLGLDTAIIVGELVERNEAYPLNSSYRIELQQLEQHFGGLLQHP